MDETSPGDDSDTLPDMQQSSTDVNRAVTGDSTSGQPNSTTVKVQISKEDTTGHPHTDIVQHVNRGLLRFCIRGSQEECPPFTCASLPGSNIAPLERKIFCSHNNIIGNECVTYHKLTDSDKSLSTVMATYLESSLVGLIIINTNNRLSLPDNFDSREGDLPLTLPVYIVSLEDGEKLQEFLIARKEEIVEVTVIFDGDVDLVPMNHREPSPDMSPQRKHSHGMLKLNEEHLYDGGKRIFVSVDQTAFTQIFSCFHNYEAHGHMKKDSSCLDKAIKLLNPSDEIFQKDFLFYLLVAHRLMRYRYEYGSSNSPNEYVTSCISRFEAITEVEAISSVLYGFIQMGDFEVQFNHIKSIKSPTKREHESVFQLSYDMTVAMLEKKKEKKSIYHRILWIALRIFFGLQVDTVEESALADVWRTELLNDKIQKKLKFSDDILKEFSKGFELLKALDLPKSVQFDYLKLATFLDPMKVKMLYFSHVTYLIEAGEICISQSTTQLQKILQMIRNNYSVLFTASKSINWEKYTPHGTRFSAYQEALKFLKHIFDSKSEPDFNKNDEDNNKRAEVIEKEIKEWLKLLVNNVDIDADDAVNYFKILQTVGFYKDFVNALVHARGMNIVQKLSVQKFYALFTQLKIWHFQFVEEFLDNCKILPTVKLTDQTWKLLLQEISDKFSDVKCKKCITGLLKHISEAYKKNNRKSLFVKDLMQLDVPKLFLTQCSEDDQYVQKLFIEMVSTFIQENALKEVILSQVIAIMNLVKSGNNLQSLILTAIQKEIVPDNKMLEKLNPSTDLAHVIDYSIQNACKSLNKLSELSQTDKFFWHFISSCCKLIQPNAGNLTKLSTHLFAIDQLGIIFQIYCTTNSVIMSITCEIPQKIKLISDVYVKDYFIWIYNIHGVLYQWHIKYSEGKFNYDDIIAYDNNLRIINDIATAVNANHLVFSDTKIAGCRQRYSKVQAELQSLLIKGNKECGWCTLVELLSEYGIQLSHSLQAKIDKHLVLSGRESISNKDNLQEELSRSNGQLKQGPKVILRLYKSMTMKVLEDIVENLQSFLKPINELLNFLVYFHLHKCKMFSRFLKNQIAELSAHSEPSGEVSTALLSLPTVSTRQSCSDTNKKLLQFASALESTRDFILSLIRGTAKYGDIFSKDLMDKFDAEKEFRILCEFSEFGEECNDEGKEGIKHMLELVEHSPQISKIPDVCSQYQLVNCLHDPRLKDLERIIGNVNIPEYRDTMTGKIATDHIKKIWKILSIDSTIAKMCLKIFSVVENCAEFYQFIKKKGFMNDNRAAFSAQVELITAQLQHEDYNETVLNNLMPAFQYISPFLDTEQNLAELMNKIARLCREGVSFGRDPTKHFCQLETVNSNITMIQLWFSKAEGDKLENAEKELKCIVENGCFKLIIKPKIIYFEKIDSEESVEDHSKVFLNFQAEKLLETWNNEQIDDFVRKLGFLENQTAEDDEQVKLFQQLNQMAQKYYCILLKLRDLGHPDYVEKEETIPCFTKIKSAESMIANAEEKLEKWKSTIKNVYKAYDNLLFFSVSKILSLHKILVEPSLSVDEIIDEIGFLFENTPDTIKKLKNTVETTAKTVKTTLSSPNTTPFEIVGKYLMQLCTEVSIEKHFLYSRNQLSKEKTSFQQMVHFAPNYDNGQLLRLLIHIYKGVPESYEVFHCSMNSTEEDLNLFLSRASKFRSQVFTILEINMLPYKLQEMILQHHSQETEQAVESPLQLHYIETANSILHEIPWIVVKEYEENGPSLQWDDAKHNCDDYVNKRNVNFDLELVYGCAGDGKTHYVNKQLFGLQPKLRIAVNESFTPLNAILKLRSLPRDNSCKVFFNFTLVNSTVDKELMCNLAWFFFKLLVFEYMEDLETGITFRLPGGHHWKIYVEVPSLHEVPQDNLDWIYNEIPVFRLLGKEKLIEKERPYDIDPSAQLVCKYLNAYKKREDREQGINRFYNEKFPDRKFSNDPNILSDRCHSLLKEYMPDHVTKNKVLQHLFIKYMERRCKFMENFPGFRFNLGAGVRFDPKSVREHELKRMIDNKVLVKTKDSCYSNTAKLGELLMKTMLDEVDEFCKIDIKQNWAAHAHQQLIYEVVKEGGGSIRLLTLKPEDLSTEKIDKFVQILRVEIPTTTQHLGREKLDSYLSSALGVPLKDNRLQDIDDAKYVLTLDYTVKMLNIHERRECGVPVIIKGETGVGKTALINMLSILWNHAIISEWKAVIKEIIDILYPKSLELKDSDLHTALQQFNANLHHDDDLNTNEKSLTEEKLMPLMELPQANDSMPFFKHVNEKLLKIKERESILELLDVDAETKEDVATHDAKQFSSSNRESSVVSYLINDAIENSSAQNTARLLCTLLNGKLISTFYKLNIHAALTPKDVQKFFIPIVKLAKLLLKIHSAKQQQQNNKPPVVTVFLDEVNTSSCMGLFKEIIIDKSFDGEPLPPNIFLVAACNPHRGNSLAVHEDKKENKLDTWVRGSYYVQKLHPTMRFVMWDYGSLNYEQEIDYIKAKMVMTNKDVSIVHNVRLSELIVECQKLMRKYAYKHLKDSGLEDSIADLCASSCVSQRDIQRVFTFYEWILKTYDILKSVKEETNHPVIAKNLKQEEMRHRALLVSLGLVYYMRLNSKYRVKFTKELDKKNFLVKFLTAFTEEMDFYTNELSLPTGIAKTEALKENLFATIICTVTKTPLIIVGAPGSSKTLSFNLTISNLKGEQSKQKLFRKTNVFKSLDPHYYQCSRRTTSTEIETVFQRAINRQRSHESFSLPIRCVVFMDEAGLPEESHESLKVLHYHLDQQVVAFVAITNHILDAAKTNRAVSLFRPTASLSDLETLAKGCLCANPDSPPPELQNCLRTIVKFCSAYRDIMMNRCIERFFGLRDFIHFVNYVRREGKSSVTPQVVLQSLERNFNGTKEFKYICSEFLGKLEDKTDYLKHRNMIEILESSLSDKQLLSNHDTLNEVRYKLIIDPSEDESITRLLFMFGILERENTRTYICSDFLGDGQLQKINTIAAIRHSAVAGHTVILNQTDDIHESFYDLFNQNFRRIDDPETGSTRYFANIAIGAHLKPSKVDPKFQCIVIVKKSEIKNTPAPFLNRFEKYFISHTNLLNLVFDKLPPCLKVIANVVYEKVKSFHSLFDSKSFYGDKEETVCSLMLSILPKPGHQYKPPKTLVTTKSPSNKMLLFHNVVKDLHELGGFCYMESSVEELQHDANCIISLLETTGSEFCGVVKKLESTDATLIFQWIVESLDLIYTADGPPEPNCESVNLLGASDGACMVTAVVTQWIMRFMCKKLMQLLTPEAAILKRKCIPISYLEIYLSYQTHFSIKELITKHSKMLNQCNDDEVATKLICYTRSTSSIHQLPEIFPRTFYSDEEFHQSKTHIEDFICEKADNVFLCKLSSVSSQTVFSTQLQTFMASQQQTIFALVINMQETSHQIINHIRIMIEEVERAKRKIKKLFILLLHFPAMMFYDPCYPSLFLCGWDHYYLDTIGQTNKPSFDIKDQTDKSSLVDTKEWFRQSCLKENTSATEINDLMLQSLLAFLHKRESILTIASRILLNIDSTELSLNSSEIAMKVNYLKELLFSKKIAKILCLKFKSYWKPSVMGDHLEQAARFSKSRESSLSVSDNVESMYRSAFFNFIAYMIYQISKCQGLDILFSDNCDNATLDLFLKLLNAYPIPPLAEVKAFNHTWDWHVHTTGRTDYVPQFPFFTKISTQISKMVEDSMAKINESVNILQEKEGSLGVDSCGSQHKEQMFKNLYEHLCTEIEKEENVEEKCLTTIAIKEMSSDEMMWQKYYNDFIHYYLNFSTTPDRLEHRLLQSTFTDTLRDYNEAKAIAVHCYLHLFQLNLAKVVASLKPLGQLQVLKFDQQLFYPKDASHSLVTTLQASKSALDISSISKFLIDLLFKVLVNVIASKDDNYRVPTLQKWFVAYRDMMSQASLKSILAINVADLNEQLKAQCHLMEVTFLVLQSFHHITDDAIECAYMLACHLSAEYFTDDHQLKGSFQFNLKETVTAFNMMFQNPQFSKLISIPHFYQYIMEGLFTHFFPDTNDTASVYNKDDIEFFLSFANKQSALKDITQSTHMDNQSRIRFSKLKIFLDRILCKGWNKNGIDAEPMSFYKLETCKFVGQTILSQCPETIPSEPGAIPSEYTPVYLQKIAKRNQNNPLMNQTLTHLYFFTILEKLQTYQFTPTQLIIMIKGTEKNFTDKLNNNAVKLIAVVEMQALSEALVYAVANNLEETADFNNLLSISKDLNSLIKDESHYNILLMHLIKKCHGLKRALKLLDRTSKEPITCLRSVKEKFKDPCFSMSHQFPFVAAKPTIKCEFNKMYKEICNHLQKVAEGGSSMNFLHYVKSMVKGDDKRRPTVQMMIWLYVYYEFYCTKKRSQELIGFFNEAQEDLGFSTSYLNILNCFLNPDNMIKEEETPTELLEYTKEEGNIIPKQPTSNVHKRDPIWELFFNTDDDSSDIELRHALANLIAVVFGLPVQSTHLWYHMFAPKDLESSFLTGFMYSSVIKKGGLTYDCGCELNKAGSYGKPDYDSRNTLSLHSWYFLLWCNFGAFCIGLLTQPTALEQIRGHILSEQMSIRHYCMAQLRKVWSHMRIDMSFGDEERSFFIMRSMYQLFMLFQQDRFPLPQGIFFALKERNEYEQAWHKFVYEPSKSNLKYELEKHSSHSVWALPVLKNFRTLELYYPHPATENDLIKCLVDSTEANNCNSTHLFVLHRFILEQKILQIGGALFPDLIEFYQWIHTELSHLVTYEKAEKVSIGNILNLSAKRYSKEYSEHLKNLFKRVKCKYHDYSKINGENTGSTTCNRAAKPTDIHDISEDTPLIKLLSLKDSSKNDWLYIVLMDIIRNHNIFLSSIYTYAEASDCHYKKFLPDILELHPTEVTNQCFIIPSNKSDKDHILKLILNHYVYDGILSTGKFDLIELEQDVVKFYIAGKPLITSDGRFRTVFRFKNSPTKITPPNSNVACAIDISAIAQELPEVYKERLLDKTHKHLEIDFHTASYHMFTEIVYGLRTVIGYLSQYIKQRKHKQWDPTKEIQLVNYLRRLFNKDDQLFDEIGIKSISDTQRKVLEGVPMKSLFHCLKLFVDWLQGGLYDFSSLPLSVFSHLKDEDIEAIMKAHTKYLSTEMEDLLSDLDEFEKSLSHAEDRLIKKENLESSITQHLSDFGLRESTKKFINSIPKTILVCHYVYFRMTVRKLKITVTTMIRSQLQKSLVANKWSEIIEDLWESLPHFQDRKEWYEESCLKLNCVTLQFGEDEESDNDSETWPNRTPNIEDVQEAHVVGEIKDETNVVTEDLSEDITSNVVTEDPHKEVNESKDEILQKLEANQELREAVMKSLVSNPRIPSSLAKQPSDKAMNMTPTELCQWLKEKNISAEYIKCFEREKVDGSELAAYNEEDLEELGVSESRIRKRIMIQFRKI